MAIYAKFSVSFVKVATLSRHNGIHKFNFFFFLTGAYVPKFLECPHTLKYNWDFTQETLQTREVTQHKGLYSFNLKFIGSV